MWWWEVGDFGKFGKLQSKFGKIVFYFKGAIWAEHINIKNFCHTWQILFLKEAGCQGGWNMTLFVIDTTHRVIRTRFSMSCNGQTLINATLEKKAFLSALTGYNKKTILTNIWLPPFSWTVTGTLLYHWSSTISCMVNCFLFGRHFYCFIKETI